MATSTDWYDLVEREENERLADDGVRPVPTQVQSYAAAVVSSTRRDKDEIVKRETSESDTRTRVRCTRPVCDVDILEIRLIRDIVRNDRNPNVVFLNFLMDDDNNVLVMCVRNCSVQRQYLFDPYGDTGRRYTGETYPQGVYETVAELSRERTRRRAQAVANVSPARALADFVLQHTFGERELVLVGSDGQLTSREALDAIRGRKETRYLDVPLYCAYCNGPAELVSARDEYACTYHATRLPSTEWYCYSSLVVDVSVDRSDETGVRLRVTNKRLSSGTTRHVTYVCYRDAVGSSPTTVATAHDALCPREHSCTSDHVGGTRIDVATRAERLVCLLRLADAALPDQNGATRVPRSEV